MMATILSLLVTSSIGTIIGLDGLYNVYIPIDKEFHVSIWATPSTGYTWQMVPSDNALLKV